MEDIERFFPVDIYKYITETVRSYTDKYLSNKQSIGLVKSKFNYVRVNYYVDETVKPTNIYSGSCIRIDNILITKDNVNDTMDNLYNDGKLYKPYLIFINDIHVSYKDIQVINTQNSTYLYFPNIPSIKKVDIYEFNFKIKIVYGTSFDKSVPYISFKGDGKLNIAAITDDCINYIVDRNDIPQIIINKFILTQGVHERILENDYKLYRRSIILFDEQGKLNDEYDDLVSINNFNTINIRKNSGIGLIIFNESQNKDDNNNFSNMFPNVEYWEEYLKNNNQLSALYDSLNIDDKRYLSKEDYYKDCVSQILSYNCRLMLNILNHLYKRHAIYKFKFKDLRVRSFQLEFFIRHDGSNENGLLLFRNGELVNKNGYSYIQLLNTLKFDVKQFKDDDDIVVIYIKDIENRNFDVTLNKFTECIDPKFDMSKAEMYTSYIEDQAYGIMNNKKVLYKIPFKYTKYDDDSYRLFPEDDKYYQSTVEIHSSDQFRQYGFEAKDTLIKIVLPSSFHTCRDINRYNVFINGRRLSQNDIKIVYPTKTTPFKTTMLYLRNPVVVGDKVDVVYSAIPMKEIINIKNITTNIIEVDKSLLSFPLFPEFHLFFINGKLIDNDSIKYLSFNKVYIPEELIDSKFNLSIVSMVDFNDEYIINLINSKEDELTLTVNNIPDNELRKMLNVGEFNKIIDNDIDATEILIENKKILKEIIKDHWIESGIYQGIPRIYDYEKADLIEDDNYINNIIELDILDAKKMNKLGKV